MALALARASVMVLLQERVPVANIRCETASRPLRRELHACWPMGCRSNEWGEWISRRFGHSMPPSRVVFGPVRVLLCGGAAGVENSCRSALGTVEHAAMYVVPSTPTSLSR